MGQSDRYRKREASRQTEREREGGERGERRGERGREGKRKTDIDPVFYLLQAIRKLLNKLFKHPLTFRLKTYSKFIKIWYI